MGATTLDPDPFRPGRRGELTIFECAELQFALQGAHVTAWRPPHARDGSPPVLFVSPGSAWRPGKAIRGGVPICFPWFGPHDTNAGLPQHGFARAREWTIAGTGRGADGRAEARLVLADDPDTRALWPHAFAAALTVAAGRQLGLALDVRNTGRAPFTFGAALHTYFAVSDACRISIGGLENTEYFDKVDGGRKKREDAAPIKLTGETDRIYLDTVAACTIDDPGWSRRIVISKKGSRTTVVWNPWADKARAMADLGDDDWRHMVCVETCNTANDIVLLAPGESHRLAVEIGIEV